jgi:hypothetical protein
MPVFLRLPPRRANLAEVDGGQALALALVRLAVDKFLVTATAATEPARPLSDARARC